MRILCLDIPAPGASLEKYAPHLNAEALHAWGLYKSGFIRDIYFRQDRRKRLVRTVLIFTESSDQLSRATDRVP
ncbi:hypothetical protein U4Z70_08755, partial [Escherichia coli]|nr:hypothetical protein [Escherichia coli]